MRAWPIIFLLLLVNRGTAQLPKPAPQAAATVWHGTFTASAGSLAQFRGRWSGQADTRNSASGSWILLNDAHKLVAEGTWVAQKSAAGWRGTWHAWVKGGRQYGGKWEAELEAFSGKTFEDMLSHTLEQQVSGSWQSGKLAGNWWLQGTKW
jgi:hypothetical protein